MSADTDLDFTTDTKPTSRAKRKYERRGVTWIAIMGLTLGALALLLVGGGVAYYVWKSERNDRDAKRKAEIESEHPRLVYEIIEAEKEIEGCQEVAKLERSYRAELEKLKEDDPRRESNRQAISDKYWASRENAIQQERNKRPPLAKKKERANKLAVEYREITTRHPDWPRREILPWGSLN
jgi:hypothetical protein